MKSNVYHIHDRIVPDFGDMVKDVVVAEKKTAGITFPWQPTTSFADYLLGNQQYDLYALEAVNLYRQCMPFYDSVNRRAGAFSALPIQLYNENTDEYSKSNAMLDIIKNPNPMQSSMAFLKSLSTNFDINGEVFLLVTGYDTPMEMYAINASYVTPTSTNQSSIPVSYLYSDGRTSERFYIDESMRYGDRYRYWNEEGTRQLWSIRDVNPTFVNTFRGLSKASPLYLEIQQFISANTNNYSILKRGGRPSLVWSWQHVDPMTDDQFERMKEQLNAYAGDGNAGKQIIADNLKPEYISHSNNEMQFKENKASVREDIYTTFGIPLSLVHAGTMTMNNLQVANIIFYEQSVLELADFLLGELSACLLPMMTKKKQLCYTYSIFDIQCLKERTYSETQTLQKSGLLTDNELRANVGYARLDGGDVVWKSTLTSTADAIIELNDSKVEYNEALAEKADADAELTESTTTIDPNETVDDEGDDSETTTTVGEE